MWFVNFKWKHNSCAGFCHNITFMALFISFTINALSVVGNEWETEDTVIVEPEITNDSDDPSIQDQVEEKENAPSRLERNFIAFPIGYAHYPIAWPVGNRGQDQRRPGPSASVVETTTPAGFQSCHTTRHEVGYCTTLRQCYPALYTNIVNEETHDLKSVIRNPGLADLLRSISGNCEISAINHEFYFKADADLLRQNLICCSTQQSNNKINIHRPSSTTTSTTMKSIPLKYPSRPKLPFGFGGHRPPNTANGLPALKETTTESHLIEPSCGIPKIIGGSEAEDGKYPWLVAILNGQKQICGGSLIDNKYILTAAHCVSHMRPNDLARLRILLGANNVKQMNQGSIIKKVSKLMRHRLFSHKTLHNDIAVLKLDSSVKFTDKISPICLDKPTQTRYENTEAIVAGWGSVKEFGAQPLQLREVKIDVWSNQQCKNKYGHLAPGGITDHMMCAGSSDRDACRGDSGGPLMVVDGEKYFQIGLVSWGIGCGRFPGVYSRIADFRHWIDKQREL